MPAVTNPINPTIPVYSLAEVSGTGNTMLEIREAKGDTPARTPDFLIPHRKDYYLFVLVKKGSSRHWVDFTPYTLQPDTFYFTIPRQVHLKEEAKPMQGLLLCFTNDFLQLEENRMLAQLPLIQNPAGGHELHLQPHDIVFIEDIMHKMLAEFRNDQSWKNQMLTSLLRVLVIHLSRLYTGQLGEPAFTQNHLLLKNFQSLIDSHHTLLHDVASYASQLNLSPGHLNERIKQQSGKTAISHIHDRIMVEAKRRLLHTELSVKQIADQLGFEDAAYFNRFFKRIAGLTPIAYRVGIREMYS